MGHIFFENQPSTRTIQSNIDEFGAWLEIDLDAITFNLQQIRDRIGDAVEVMPVIKNDAYGHGLIPMTAHLYAQGCRKMMVAKLWEAFALRRAVPECEIVCMDALHTDRQFQRVVETGVIPVIYDASAAERLSTTAGNLSKTARVFVKIDTGLRRVGVAFNEAPKLIADIQAMSNIEIVAVMSTFMQHPDHDALLLERFVQTCEKAGITGTEGIQRSMGSTNSILHLPGTELEMVRPAMCLFGIYPFEGDEDSGLALRQALTMNARLEMVKSIESGESVSYFGSFVATKQMRIGTLHAGFFDGIPREAANKAIYRFGDIDCATLGSISLNHTLVDLTGTEAAPGDIVTIIGREGECTMKAFSDRAGWMPYSVLNHLNLLLPRVYTKGGEPIALLDRAAQLYGV
ncbi:MAG: alanine racemase [bacterium]